MEAAARFDFLLYLPTTYGQLSQNSAHGVVPAKSFPVSAVYDIDIKICTLNASLKQLGEKSHY